MSGQVGQSERWGGWYGKLPCTGDFVSRGLPSPLVQLLDIWFHEGLIQLRHRRPDWQQLFLASPAWSFVVPGGAMGDEPLLGCLVASADRVGRLFPLIALSSFGKGASLEKNLPPFRRWHSATVEVMFDAMKDVMSIDDFDSEFRRISGPRRPVATHSSFDSDLLDRGSILEILGDGHEGVVGIDSGTGQSLPESLAKQAFAWPELTSLFVNDDFRSFWWTLGGGTLSKRLAHDGPLTAHLFTTLFTQVDHQAGLSVAGLSSNSGSGIA